jgi:excisionase family DNA binding protein
MPTRKQMERMAAAVGGRAPAMRGLAPDDELPPEYWQALLDDPRVDGGQPDPGASERSQRLSQIPQQLLRASCRRCARTVEIQRVDAVRLYGPDATWGTSASGCWTTPARCRPGAMRKTAAGRRMTCRSRRALANYQHGNGQPDPRVGEFFDHLRQALNILEELISCPAAMETPSPAVATKSHEDERPAAAFAEKLAYSIKEVCNLADVSRSTLYMHIGEGKLRTVKRGNRTLVLAVDLRDWIASWPQSL